MVEIIEFPGDRANLPEQTLPQSIQESLLALLAHNDKYGTIVAAQILPKYFDAPYQEFATKILAYRREYGRPPGHVHLDDIFGDSLFRGEKAQRNRRLLTGINELAKGLNAEFVANKAKEFIERQVLKSAVMRASEAYGTNVDTATIRGGLYAALKAQQQGISTGTRLGSSEEFAFLERKPVDIPIGIKELENIEFGPTAKQLLLYIASKETGKSWFSVYIGKQGIIHRAKVLHITCEMEEPLVEERYYQAFFSIAKRRANYLKTTLARDELKRLIGWDSDRVKPKVTFADPNIRKFLREKQKQHYRLGSLIIKEFPSGSLTLSGLEFYLDYLESMEKFIPTLVIIDYPDLMKHDLNNFRLSIGQTFVGLRGIASQRNFALVAPTQGSKISFGAKRVQSTMVTEDISKVFTADNVLTYSQTEAEKKLGLARLYVNHARNTESGYEIVISQAYAIGQFALDSALKTTKYIEQFRGDSDE